MPRRWRPCAGAIEHLLQANNPAPAIVIDGNWDVLAANGAASALFALLGLPPSQVEGLNMLAMLFAPGGWANSCSMPKRFVRWVGTVPVRSRWAIRYWQSAWHSWRCRAV
jgi:hypothetical protein